MLNDLDTIVATATAQGATAALSIIRISGAKTPEITQKCFTKPINFNEAGKFYFGNWINNLNSDIIDEVVLLAYPKGHGFTGEAAVEIICHGNPLIVDQIIETVLNCNVRLAKPGEFSYRAVLNNKITLTQAEAVLDLIHSKSLLKTKQSLRNLKGELHKTISEIEKELLYVLAHLEASIDFTTEDIQPVSFLEMANKLDNINLKLTNLISSYQQTIELDAGVRIVIAGKPNAGKSSLLNKFVGKEKSIVTPFAGTTRDVIETQIYINGLPTTIIDTAGIRSTENVIEQMGVKKAFDEIQTANIILYLIDIGEGISKEDVEQIKSLDKEKLIICLNKSDLANTPFSFDLLNLNEFTVVKTNSVQTEGLKDLRDLIISKTSSMFDTETQNMVSSKRHFEELKNAQRFTLNAKELINNNQSPDLVSFEVKEALTSIKNILYKEMNDEVLDLIFKEFCIGK